MDYRMTTITIKATSENKYEAILNHKRYPCALGRNGITSSKHEGDGATPAGLWPIREVYYRSDKITLPENIKFTAISITPEMGWGDDPEAPDYNRFIPDASNCNYSHEKLWRDDHRYDLIINVGYNDNPPIAGKGSAIFIHVTQDYNTPSAGCITFEIEHLLEIIEMLDYDSYVDVLV